MDERVRQSWRAAIPLVVALVALCAGASSARASRATVTPADSLVDAPVQIRVSGLTPKAAVTLPATTTDAGGATWVSSADFVADRGGVVDPSVASAVRGSYTGRDGMGLFWSLLPKASQGSPDGVSYSPPPSATVQIAVLAGGQTLASAQIVRRTTSPGVSVSSESVATNGFVGQYCTAAPGGGPRPAVVVLGGNTGGIGLGTTMCTVLASDGYPTLSLAYFGQPGLPSFTDPVPLEYFGRALQWLGRQPGVDPSRLVVMGTSLGGEAALLVGASFPTLVDGVIGYVPKSSISGMMHWTLAGKPFLSGLQIPVEQIAGPVLVVGAGLDPGWYSSGSVQAVATRLRQHHHAVTALVYPKVGHGLGSILPNLRTPTVLQTQIGPVALLGTLAANEAARAAAWKAVLQYLAKL